VLHRKRLTYFLYRGSKRMSGWLIVFIGIESGLAKLPEKQAPVAAIYHFLQWQATEYAWWLIVLASLLVGLCLQTQKACGSSEVWDVLHSLLCGTQRLVFAGGGRSVGDFHRVTLFHARCYRNKWDICGMIAEAFQGRPRWLVPVARSGHTSQDTTTAFRIGDSDEECAGIAGQCWFRKQNVSASALPDLYTNSRDKDFRTYAKQTHVTPEALKEKPPHARSFLAYPIQVKGELWGAMVFDSRSPDPIDQTCVDQTCELISNHIGNLIEKIL
jgi:hypothetical protein